MRNVASIEIDRAIDEVFVYTNEQVSQWSLTVVENEVIEEHNGVGTTFRCITEEKGSRMDFEGVITAWQPPTKSAIHLTGKFFDIDVEYRFEDLNGQTRVTQESKVVGKGIAKILFVLFGWMMNKQSYKAAMAELESLKNKLESGAGHQRDGT